MKTLIRSMVMTFIISAFAAWSALAGELTIPFPDFEAGTPAIADQVDDNFAAVKDEVDDNDGRINT